MHYVMRNTQNGSDKDYVVTTGAGLVECRNGRHGRTMVLAKSHPISGDVGDENALAMKIVERKRKEGYILDRSSGLSLLTLDPAWITVRPLAMTRDDIIRASEAISQGRSQLHGLTKWKVNRARLGCSAILLHEDGRVSIEGNQGVMPGVGLTGPALVMARYGGPMANIAIAMMHAQKAVMVTHPGYAIGKSWPDSEPQSLLRTLDDARALKESRKAFDAFEANPSWMAFADALARDEPASEPMGEVASWLEDIRSQAVVLL